MIRDILPIGPNGIDWPRALLLVLTLAIIAATGVYAATSTTAFGPYNSAWNGASDLRDQIQSDSTVDGDIGRDTARYEEVAPEDTVAIVIAPSEPYTDRDAERVREFVAAGGTLVVFENFGTHGDSLLADIGAEARTDGRILRDERHHYRGPTMPIATGVTNHSLTRNVDQLTLNYATAVEPGNATVLVTSSKYAYLVTGPDDSIDETDDLTTYPIATVESIENGQVVVVGDPSLTINAMLTQPDNAAFVQGLYAEEGQVLLDLSHAGDIPPLSAAILMIRESPPVQFLLGTAGIGLIAALATGQLRPAIKRTRQLVSKNDLTASGYTTRHPNLTTEERIAYLRQQYPEWDEARIRRVIAGLNHSREESGDE